MTRRDHGPMFVKWVLGATLFLISFIYCDLAPGNSLRFAERAKTELATSQRPANKTTNFFRSVIFRSCPIDVVSSFTTRQRDLAASQFTRNVKINLVANLSRFRFVTHFPPILIVNAFTAADDYFI